MPDFKSKEEYERWKAERLKQSKDNSKKEISKETKTKSDSPYESKILSASSNNKKVDDSINSIPLEKKKKLLSPIKIGFIVAFCILVLVGGWIYSGIKYSNSLKEVIKEITVQAGLAEIIARKHSEAWRDAIDSRIDFNMAIYTSINILKDDISKLKTEQNIIEKKMSSLRNPPNKYKKAYELAFELYSYYSELVSLTKNPQGSLLTFNQKVNDLSLNINKKKSELNVFLPKDESPEVKVSPETSISSDSWTVFLDEKSEVNYFDSQGVTHLGNDLIRVWSKKVILKDMPLIDFKEIYNLDEINCNQKTFHVLKQKILKKDGTWEINENTDTLMENISPGSPIEHLFETVCKK